MAKVTGPLMSMSASGKLGKAIVFFPWKGISVVREWLKPSNPQTGAQGNRRIMLGGLGRAVSPISPLSQFATYAREATPTGQTWVSKLVKYMIDNYMSTVVAFDSLYDEYSGLGQLADWVAEATDLGLKTFNLDYKSMDHGFIPGFQLYCIGKFATQMHVFDNTKFNAAPYTKTFADWGLTDIQEMVAHFTAL